MTGTRVKLGKETLAILKNFATLNSNILIHEGNTFQTLTPTKNVMAMATVEEQFPTKFGVWDLNKFLSTVSLFSDPYFEFEDKFVIIGDENGSSVKYHYCDESVLTIPTREINMPESVVSITIDQSTFSELQKASSVLELPDLSVVPSEDGQTILAVVDDRTDPTSNNFSVTLGENTCEKDFVFNFKSDLLRMYPGNYTVNFTETVISEFCNNDLDLTYYIALEASSKYGD